MIKVYTETICERCGHVEKVEGDHFLPFDNILRLIVPERWGLLSLSYWEDKTWREDNKVALCPTCAKAAETFMKPTKKPEKPARKPRSDKGVPKKRSITKTDTNEQVEMPTPDMKQIEEGPKPSDKLEIHGPDGDGLFKAEFLGKTAESGSLQRALLGLKDHFNPWPPEEMSAPDRQLVEDIIEGKKPE